ncbi:PREDICTED: adenosine receptor A2b-like, partial [Priapulus caudatus]|uniref:Adenosine receptor A2b-like n=1 Tax=Priapulus caudatus TaxID=37621 RepID=A0ABM1F7G1_PRICU
RTAKLQTNTTRFVASLAGADALFGAVYFVVRLLMMTLGEQHHSRASCVFTTAVVVFAVASTMTSLVLITADRFFAVTRPVLYKTRLTRRVARRLIAFSWTYGAATTCTRIVYFLVANYVVVLLVMVYTYVAILRLSLARVAHQHAGGATVAPSPFKSRTTQMTVIIISLAVTCMLPHMVYMVAIHARGSHEPYGWLRNVRSVLLVLNSLANPFIYVWQNRQFRAAILALVCKQTSATYDCRDATRRHAYVDASLVQDGGLANRTRAETLCGE